jgi:hypothetical protein
MFILIKFNAGLSLTVTYSLRECNMKATSVDGCYENGVLHTKNHNYLKTVIEMMYELIQYQREAFRISERCPIGVTVV